MVQSNLNLILILFEKTSLFALKIKGTTGIIEGLKYRGKLFGLIIVMMVNDEHTYIVHIKINCFQAFVFNPILRSGKHS